jgi:hypothetical protein
MSAGRATALRVLLGVAHVLTGAVLLLPMASLAGFASPRGLASPPLPVALMVLSLVVFPAWILLMGIRSFWPRTPGAIRALRWTHSVAIAVSLLGLGGLLMLQAAERSASHGGGLLGGFGPLPIAPGLLVGGLVLASLWLLRAVARVQSSRR